MNEQEIFIYLNRGLDALDEAEYELGKRFEDYWRTGKGLEEGEEKLEGLAWEFVQGWAKLRKVVEDLNVELYSIYQKERENAI